MVIAFDPSGIYDWVHKLDRELPPERQTTFGINVLTLSERDWLTQRVVEVSSDPKKATQVTMDALRLGIGSIRNLLAPTGDAIEPKFGPPPNSLRCTQRTQVLSDETLRLIPPEYHDGLFTEVITGASANEADRKK